MSQRIYTTLITLLCAVAVLYYSHRRAVIHPAVTPVVSDVPLNVTLTLTPTTNASASQYGPPIPASPSVPISVGTAKIAINDETVMAQYSDIGPGVELFKTDNYTFLGEVNYEATQSAGWGAAPGGTSVNFIPPGAATNSTALTMPTDHDTVQIVDNFPVPGYYQIKVNGYASETVTLKEGGKIISQTIYNGSAPSPEYLYVTVYELDILWNGADTIPDSQSSSTKYSTGNKITNKSPCMVIGMHVKLQAQGQPADLFPNPLPASMNGTWTIPGTGFLSTADGAAIYQFLPLWATVPHKEEEDNEYTVVPANILQWKPKVQTAEITTGDAIVIPAPATYNRYTATLLLGNIELTYTLTPQPPPTGANWTSFYWANIDPTTVPKPVKFSVQVMNRTVTARTTFVLEKPTITVNAPTGVTSFDADYAPNRGELWLHCGAPLVNLGWGPGSLEVYPTITNPKDFPGTVVPDQPPNNPTPSGGLFNFIQVMDTTYELREEPGKYFGSNWVQNEKSDGLDTSYPYGNARSPDVAGHPVGFYDAPGTEVATASNTLAYFEYREDYFTNYVVYEPPGVDVMFVPIYMIRYKWSGGAQWVQSKGSGFNANNWNTWDLTNATILNQGATSVGWYSWYENVAPRTMIPAEKKERID